MAKFRFTKQEAVLMAEELLKAGMHPRRVRQELSKRGIHWEYQFVGQGRREKVRRLRRMGLELCHCGDGTYPIGSPAERCSTCLEAKWRNKQVPDTLPGEHRTDSGLILP